MGAQPGTAPHDQRRPRHRHPRRHARAAASTSSRTACSPRRPRRAAATRSFDRDGNAGVDLFYNPTPLPAREPHVNTDFAQTEVDQRQVNLTRFSLFFPEKRDFFLDGATFFDFGSPTDADLRVNPFFSRRIGLSADAHAAADQLRHQGHRAGGRPGRRPAPRADRRRRRRRVHRRGLHGGARRSAGCSRSRTSARMYTRRDQRARRRARRGTPPALDFRLATQQLPRLAEPRGHRLVPARRRDPASRAATAPSAPPSTTRTTGGTRAFDAQRGPGRTSTRRSASSRAATTAATRRSSRSRRGPRGHRYIRQLHVRAATPTSRPTSTTSCSRAGSTSRSCEVQLHSQDNVRVRRRARRASGSTRRSRSAAASRCRSARSTTSRATSSAGRRRTAACSRSTGRYEPGRVLLRHARRDGRQPHRPHARPATSST